MFFFMMVPINWLKKWSNLLWQSVKKLVLLMITHFK
ncbi:hypothetical protein HMPREF0525_01540 [Lactobacillus jensenii 27-2-CHN]|jgi:hypothetical protein|nr:hypothetical protein HMPREF0525_01540 [Lactobacillus jensenii 27-2-CHN]ERJ42026.1 hypothetical protein N581_10670 [Lactobacillus jensenii MD IIE-70(2)]